MSEAGVGGGGGGGGYGGAMPGSSVGYVGGGPTSGPAGSTHGMNSPGNTVGVVGTQNSPIGSSTGLFGGSQGSNTLGSASGYGGVGPASPASGATPGGPAPGGPASGAAPGGPASGAAPGGDVAGGGSAPGGAAPGGGGNAGSAGGGAGTGGADIRGFWTAAPDGGWQWQPAGWQGGDFAAPGSVARGVFDRRGNKARREGPRRSDPTPAPRTRGAQQATTRAAERAQGTLERVFNELQRANKFAAQTPARAGTRTQRRR